MSFAAVPFHSHEPPRKRPNKIHVSAACVNCKKAHLACDVSRPCQRCINTDKMDSCHDVQHKKRGRPKMMRDSNNNKIRTTVPNLTRPISTQPNLPVSMTLILSMDLCCARVTDESLEYLQLYPQEFSHRSIYDFLLPGPTHQVMSKLHRCLLDNVVQHQSNTLLPSHQLVRSSSESFFKLSIPTLLTIANGSFTLKSQLSFKYGNESIKTHQEMQCQFYLGGGLGADLFNSKSLDQLYIVCVLAPSAVADQNNTIDHDTCSNSSTSLSPTASSSLLETSLLETSLLETSASSSLLETSAPAPPAAASLLEISASSLIEEEEEEKEKSDPVNLISIAPHIPTPSYTYEYDDDDESGDQDMGDINTKEELERIKEGTGQFKLDKPTVTHTHPTAEITMTTQLDRLRTQVNRTNKQWIHPHELYYRNITSSRLSADAVAHTSSPYLTRLPSHQQSGSSSLAAYNCSFNNSIKNN